MVSVPAGVYGRRIPAGGIPILAAIDPSAAFRITMAAIDPTAAAQIDEDNQTLRATLKLIRVPMDFDDEDEDDEDMDIDDSDIEAIAARLRAAGALPDADSDMSEDSDSEANGAGPSDPVKSKKAKQAAIKKKLQEELEDQMDLDAKKPNGVNGKGKAKVTDEDISDDEDDSEDDEDDEPEEFVLCTLNPDSHYQQPLDITIREGEEVYLSVSGTHDVYVTGNYIAFQDEEDDSEDDEDDGLEELGYDLGSDEDELDADELDESEDDELDGMQDPRITEVESESEAPKLVEAGKKNKKRAAESEDDATLDDLMSKANGDAKLSKKAAKKLKKNDGQAVAGAEPAKADKTEAPNSDKKKVQFAKNLEQGPTGSPKVDAPKPEAKKEAAKGPRVVSGVTIDDKKDGKGKAAKKGDRVEMRYIGKLKNGKVFDSNKKGKPFSFKLGVGQVIKGWDVGVAGMTPGSERRLSIPAALAYGKKGAPPDIPANSDLVFDIKCISVG